MPETLDACYLSVFFCRKYVLSIFLKMLNSQLSVQDLIGLIQ